MTWDLKNVNSIEYMDYLISQGKINVYDAIITDPPYNISRKNNFKSIGRFGIDFGEWDKGFNQCEWIVKAAKLVRPGGTIIIFNDWKNLGDISRVLEQNCFSVKDIIRWEKTNPMPRNCNRRYVVDYEFAVWAVKKGNRWCFNNTTKKYLRPVIKCSSVKTHKIHPTQKPLELLKQLILVHTKQGDTIFDPFMGSGSTGVAALLNNRNFVGCELNKTYFNFANEWINSLNLQNEKCFKPVRSPLYYVGDKINILDQIFPLFPKNINTFIDAFGGGGTVIANCNYKQGIFNDNGKDVTKLVKYLYTNSADFIYSEFLKWQKKFNLIKPTKNNKNFASQNYNNARQFFNNNKDNMNQNDYLSLLFTLIVFSFNSLIRFNSENKFNVPVGKQDLNNKRKEALFRFINIISHKKIKFLSEDFEFLYKQKFEQDDFVYFDPPYSITLATYNATWSEKDDIRLFKLLDFLNGKGVKWALSNVLCSKGKENKNLKKWSSKYKVNFIKKDYKNSNYHRKNLGDDCEVLITNYEK